MNVRLSPAFSRSIPTHLLSHGTSPSAFQQLRYRSTFLSRRTYITRKPLVRCIYQVPTHRRIEIDPTTQIKCQENIQTVERFKKSLCVVASRMRRGARFGTSTAHNNSNNGDFTKPPSLTHLTSTGAAHMVNVGHKRVTHRSATAVSHLLFSNSTTYSALTDKDLAKGDALAVARIAGIQGAKKTADLIPLAHPGLGITSITIDIDPISATKDSSGRISEDNLPDTTTDSTAQHDLPILRTKFGGVRVIATVKCVGKTGVEMEALTAASIATLTLYDMLKAIDKGMLITGGRVIEKKGGKSGSWRYNSKTRGIEKVNDDDKEDTNASLSEPVSEGTASTANATTTHSSQDDESTPQSHSSQLYPNPLSTSTPSTSAPATNPPPNDENHIHNENSAQAVLAAEWASLASSFSNTVPNPNLNPIFQSDIDDSHHSSFPSSSAAAHTTEPNNELELENQENEVDLRDQFSGNAHAKPNAAAFRNARIQRYEEWKKTH